MGFELEKCTEKETLKKIKKLYAGAFPREERAPFFMLVSKARKGRGDMLAAKDNGEFIGLAYTICHKDLVYIFYLAVESGRRGKGYGGKILSKLKEIYSEKRIFLAREQLDENSDNYEQRLSRHKFYLSNGFKDLDCRIKEANVIYDVMGIGGEVAAKEYETLITKWGGWLIVKLIDMKIIE